MKKSDKSLKDKKAKEKTKINLDSDKDNNKVELSKDSDKQFMQTDIEPKKTKEFVGKWKANCCRVCKQYDSDGWMPKSSGNCL